MGGLQPHDPAAEAIARAATDAASAAGADGFLPHGYCFLWNKPLLWTHVLSDLLIGLSYVTIAFTLALFVHRMRRDIPFSVVFVAFGTFIIACGMTHFMEVWTFWQPVYWLSGAVKVVTVVASVSTAAVLPFVVPRAQATIGEARLSRDREVRAARAAALEEANGELLRLNESLQQALREAQEARAVAESANHAKARFLAVMSHELRTPLNAITGYADLLDLGIAGTLEPPQRVYVDRIRGSATHLVGLIDGILQFARVETGREPIQLAEVDAGEVAREALDLVRPMAVEKGLALHEALPPRGALPMTTDARLLRQVLLNLLTNAIKYTPAGHVRLALEADGERVRLAVADTGVGIAPEHLARVFEPFFQAEPAFTRSVGGTGLGLSIVRQLATALGGVVEVESEAGAGSTFTVLLPRVSRPAGERANAMA